MYKRLFEVLSIFSTIFGFVSIILFLINLISWGIIFLVLYILFNIIIILKDKKQKKLFILELFMSILLFPYFPLILFFHIKKIKPLYSPIDFEEGKLDITGNISFSSVDLAPFYIILKYGDPQQRKYVVRLVYNSILENKVDFIDGIELIRNAIKIDSHPDVVLYASDALTNLEKYLISSISYYMKNLNSLEDYINFGKYSYYYAKSGFLAGEHEKEILWQALIILRPSIETFPESPDLIFYTFKIMELLNEYAELENMLREKLNTFKHQKILEYAIFYYIKKRKPKVVQELVSLYMDLGFSPENDAIKFILGG
ncbi:hypothetical protein [Marinitoga litoralis]|uniref:hypothetical protein n=1 Tax=Marinitoga litoralis TaxID=570855 RepID=UPI00196124B5|nr:hypothetical protein [Marinitoga litoralis]MBM7558485.1 hypothetical protein [Marinitoga litoralis]